MKIDINVDPGGGGNVKIDDTILDYYPRTRTFTKYTLIHLEALPEPGYAFTHWGGDISGTESQTEIYVDVYQEVIAYFTNILHDLNVESSGQGSTSLVGTQTYGEGSQVEITATPDKGWRFDGWSGDVANPTAETTTVTIDADKTVTANFSWIMHDLTIDIEGQGTTSLPAGTTSYGEGIELEITATPDAGWRFEGWSGDADDPDVETITVLMSKDRAVAVSFSQIMHNLKVSTSGQGSTNLTGTESYGEGSQVEITAVPKDGWQFDGWSGDVADPTAATTTVLIDTDKTIMANFSQKTPWALIFGLIGGGLGAGLGTYRATRRRKNQPGTPPTPVQPATK